MIFHLVYKYVGITLTKFTIFFYFQLGEQAVKCRAYAKALHYKVKKKMFFFSPSFTISPSFSVLLILSKANHDA
jgi:hypothetical protein